jgi:hypothetical protein
MTKKTRRGRRGPGQHFDERQLTGEDRALLAAFVRRREGFERAIEASNVIYHKYTCPACGFPSMDRRGDYGVCVVCLWEDAVDETAPTWVGPPNYVALVQRRIEVAGMIAAFERVETIVDSLGEVVRSIRDFEAKLACGDAAIAHGDLLAHLRGVLPTTPRGARDQ